MKISKSERDSGLLSERNFKAGVRTLKECGFVVIEDAISCSWVDRTRAACDRALNQCMEALTPEKREPMQRTNVPMFPPVCSPFMDAVAIENPLAVQVSEALYKYGRDLHANVNLFSKVTADIDGNLLFVAGRPAGTGFGWLGKERLTPSLPAG